MIWRIVLLAACVQVTWSTYSTPIDTWSDPFWILQHSNVPRQLYLSDVLRQRLVQLQKTSAKGQKVTNAVPKSQDKRAFSILARLRPFSDLGKQRTSIKQISKSSLPLSIFADNRDIEPRARPMGQPLRWG